VEDTEERRRQRERLVAYFIGGLVREHGINVSDQPGPVARLHHFAEIGQSALEEDRLEALAVNDQEIAIGLDGSPIPFRVNIEKNMLRSILDGAIPPPVDDAVSLAARIVRREQLQRDKQAAQAALDESQRIKELEARRNDEEQERRAWALRRTRKIMVIVAVAFVSVMVAIVFLASHGHGEHEKKSEGRH
jgi:hypothetical protein